MCKMLVLVNPVFERRQSRDLPLILKAFQESGAAVEVMETGENRAAGEKAHRAIAEGVDRIVVCGGDGTVFDVIQGMAGSDVPLGIIPFGTGNVLAQNLKIPGDPVKAAHWVLAAKPRSVALGRLTHCTPAGQKSWFFAMAAGMGVHAALMTAARRLGKKAGGRAAYFAAGLHLLFSHPLEPFDIEITSTAGELLQRRVSEAIAVRVGELNIWRPGGGLDLPFLRLATVEAGAKVGAQNPVPPSGSRFQLATAAFAGLFLSAGARDREQREDAPARYEDVLRVVCRPIAGYRYKVPLAVQADGEVLDASCAVIEMAGVNLQLLSAPA